MTLRAEKKTWREELDNGLLCLLGSLLLALGMSMFLLPNQIASGGTPGIAILICHLTGLTAGMVMLLINIPLLIVGGYYLGQQFVWRSVLAIVMISGLVDLFYEIIRIPAGTDTPLLAAIFGGAGIGFGVGLILKGGASAGGPTIIARILATHSDLRPGYLVLFMDAVIVCSSAIVFGAIEPALHSLLSVFVTGRCIDLILGNKELKGPPFPQHIAGEVASTD
jgi:uncharacterized membrane-anchored protein YitT (DUF2179 family)